MAKRSALREVTKRGVLPFEAMLREALNREKIVLCTWSFVHE